MWFFFGIFTLIAATIWGLERRLAAAWDGVPDRIGGNKFELDEVRNNGHLRLVRLGASAPEGLHFRVRSERLHDRFFKWLGVTAEIQTHDEEFDRTLYVESDARAVAILLRRNAKMRAALVDIFVYAKTSRMRTMRLRCANERIWLEFMPKDQGDLFAAKTYLAPLLHTISSGLECVNVPAEYRRDRFVWRAAAALAFSTGTLVLGVFGLTRSIVGRTDILDPQLLFLTCLVPALIVLMAGAFFLLAWLMASSRAHTVVLEFVLIGGVGLVSGTYALAREANMELDRHPATGHVLTDVRTEHRVTKRRRKRSHHYYVYGADWRKGHEGERLKLEISSSTYRSLQSGQSAIVYVRPGLFGFDWVEKIEPNW